MTEELEGLTLEAVDALRDAIEKRGGIIATGQWQNECGSCALGSLGQWGKSHEELTLEDGLFRNKMVSFGLGEVNHQRYIGDGGPGEGLVLRLSQTGTVVSNKSEFFVGTPAERKEYMLDWLRQQHDLKCSGWSPPTKERVPARKERKNHANAYPYDGATPKREVNLGEREGSFAVGAYHEPRFDTPSYAWAGVPSFHGALRVGGGADDGQVSLSRRTRMGDS